MEYIGFLTNPFHNTSIIFLTVTYLVICSNLLKKSRIIFYTSKVNVLQNEPGYKCKKIHFMQTEMFSVKGGTRISWHFYTLAQLVNLLLKWPRIVLFVFLWDIYNHLLKCLLSWEKSSNCVYKDYYNNI